MTDRKLLEAAAKAAGGIRPDLDCQWNGSGLWFSGNGEGVLWNPLTDDGDALRLAVKLRMNVFHAAIKVYALDEDGGIEVEQGHENDPIAATRRAIVRAAAAMST